MAVKSMQVLYLGSDYLDKSRITPSVARDTMVEAVFLSFLIRADEGNLLVDAGFHPDDAEAENAMGLQINVQPQDHLPRRLEEVGLSMADISTVVLTHLDLDHIGWLADLAHAEFVVQKLEYQFALDPPPYARFRFRYPHRYNAPEIKWRLIDGDQILIPGLTLLHTPGHSPGCQSIMVDLPESGPFILVGDAGHCRQDFDLERIPVYTDARQAYYSMKRLKVWSQVRRAALFPTHDIDIWRHEMRKPPEAYH